MAAVRSRHVRHHRDRLGIAASVALGIHALGILALVPMLRRTPPRSRDEVASIPTPPALAGLPLEAPVWAEPPQPVQVIEVIPPDVEEPPPPETPRVAEYDVNPARETHKPGRMAAPGPERTAGEVLRAAPTPPATEPPPMPPQAVVMQERDQDEDPEAEPLTGPNAVERGRAAEASVARPGPAPPATPRAEVGDPLPTIGLGRGTDDHLPDVPVGADTAVRARRSALAAFVNQVRSQVRERWRPSDVYRREVPNPTVSGEVLTTSLRVRVRADGTLATTDLQSGSGIAALDAEAVRAMEQAQPFPKPPPEVLDPSGGLSFSFDFHLDLAMIAFRASVCRLVMEQWKPSSAFRKFGLNDRVTIVRALLTSEGILAHVSVVASSGLDLLDEGTLAAFKPRMRFPAPPAALGEVAGIIPVRIRFLHSVRGQNEVRILHDSRSDNPR